MYRFYNLQISQKTYHESASVRTCGLFFLAIRIARGKFSQLKEQARENLVFAANKTNNTPFVNSQKALIPVNTTKELAAELKTSDQTASRIIQIQAKSAVS